MIKRLLLTFAAAVISMVIVVVVVVAVGVLGTGLSRLTGWWTPVCLAIVSAAFLLVGTYFSISREDVEKVWPTKSKIKK